MRADLEAVGVPERNHGQRRGKVLLKRRRQRVAVHFGRALQELEENLGPERECERQAHCAPDGESAADPVPHAEEVLLGQAHLGGRVGVGRDDHHVVRTVRAHDAVVEQPLVDGCGVDERLAGAEALRGDDDEGRQRIADVENALKEHAVDGGEKMDADLRIGGTKRMVDRVRPHVGAADADVDHVGDAVTPAAEADALAHLAREVEHAATLAVDLGELRRTGRKGSQRSVKRCAPFARIDDLARHHAAVRLLDAARAAVVDKALEVLARQALAGDVKADPAGGHHGVHACAVAQEGKQGPVVRISHEENS